MKKIELLQKRGGLISKFVPFRYHLTCKIIISELKFQDEKDRQIVEK